MKFLSHKDKPIVNLGNVSSIYFQQRENTIIFNMNFSVNNVDSSNRNMRVTSAIFWELDDMTEMKKVSEKVKNIINKNNFLFLFINENRCVNLESVSSIKVDEFKRRIIFNMNFAFNHPKDQNYLSNDFVYLNAKTEKEFEQNKELVSSLSTNV